MRVASPSREPPVRRGALVAVVLWLLAIAAIVVWNEIERDPCAMQPGMVDPPGPECSP